MSILPIEPAAGLPFVSGLPELPALPAVDATAGTPNADFAAMVTGGLEKLEAMRDTTDSLAVRAATGDLTDVHDYMIASARSSVATELTVAVRNKAVEAFTEIMRMSV